jgi:hypothetical protein
LVDAFFPVLKSMDFRSSFDNGPAISSRTASEASLKLHLVDRPAGLVVVLKLQTLVQRNPALVDETA